jgi:hypothetical protein
MNAWYESAMVRLPQVFDHQGAAKPGKQEQEQRCDITFHPKAKL